MNGLDFLKQPVTENELIRMLVENPKIMDVLPEEKLSPETFVAACYIKPDFLHHIPEKYKNEAFFEKLVKLDIGNIIFVPNQYVSDRILEHAIPYHPKLSPDQFSQIKDPEIAEKLLSRMNSIYLQKYVPFLAEECISPELIKRWTAIDLETIKPFVKRGYDVPMSIAERAFMCAHFYLDRFLKEVAQSPSLCVVGVYYRLIKESEVKPEIEIGENVYSFSKRVEKALSTELYPLYAEALYQGQTIRMQSQDKQKNDIQLEITWDKEKNVMHCIKSGLSHIQKAKSNIFCQSLS